MPKLSIIIPAYNEEEHITEVVHSLLAVRPKMILDSGLDEIEVIVVNDGSTDTTGEKLGTLSQEGNTSFRVVTHPQNLGYGAALKTGFGEAAGDFLCFMDADGTISPESFVTMYRELLATKADMVVGSRLGKKDSEMPLIRRIGNLFFATLLSFLSGQRVKDTASGMRLFRKTIVPQLLPLPDGLHFTPAMSTKALHERLRIVEIPIPYAERSGESKLRVVSDGIRFLRIIVGTVLMYNPFKVFFLVGLVFEVCSAALMSEPLYVFFSGEHVSFSDYIYRSIGAMYFFTIGIQIMLFGVLARFIVSTFFRRHESGQIIHHMNRALRVYEWMGFYGLGVLATGAAINALYFWKYVFGGGLSLHWSFLLLGAGFIIVGVEMVITGVVMRILKDIRAVLDVR